MGRIGGCQEWDNCYNLKLIYLVALTLTEFFVEQTDSVADSIQHPPPFSSNLFDDFSVPYITLKLLHFFGFHNWFVEKVYLKHKGEEDKALPQSLMVLQCAVCSCTTCLCNRKFLLSTSINSCQKEFCLFDHSTESRKGYFGGKGMHRERPEHGLSRLNVLMFGRV